MKLRIVVRANGAGAAAVPASLLVLGAFRRSIDAGGGEGEILAAAHELARLHARRLGLVNARREPGVSDHHVAACVHLIDQIDSERAEFVLTINWCVARAISGRAPILHSETLGAVIDRMAQMFAVMNAAAAPPDSEQAHRSSCAVAELAAAYDDLVADLSAARCQVPQW